MGRGRTRTGPGLSKCSLIKGWGMMNLQVKGGVIFVGAAMVGRGGGDRGRAG